MDPAQSGSVESTADDDASLRLFDPRHSLRARAVLVFGTAALVFSFALWWIAGALFQRHLERALGPSFDTLASQIGDKLDRSLYERMRALQFAANLAPLRTAGATTEQLRPALDALLDTSPDCVWVGFAGVDGTIVAAAPRLFEGTSAAARPWFSGARRQTYAGNPHEFPELASELPTLGADSNPPFIDLAVPVTDSAGKPLGVLAAHLRWSWARDTLNTVVPETARRDHLGVTIYSANHEILLDTGATNWTEPPPAPRPADLSGLHGSFTEVVSGDTTYLTGYARSRGFRTFRGMGWLVTVRQPATDAFAPVSVLRHRLWQFGAILCLATVGFVWLFTWHLTWRVNAIAKAAARVGAGDILALLPLPHGRDEFQKMCTALGAMVARFREREEKLETENTRLAARLHAQDVAKKS